MYELYIGNKNYSSWSLRPWLLATELDIAFEEHLVAFDDGGSFTEVVFTASGNVSSGADRPWIMATASWASLSSGVRWR